MNNAQMSARVGLFFILGLALVWVVFESLGSGSMFRSKGYNIVATFDDVKLLKAGDEVRIAGVKVGAVTETRLTGQRAEALIQIEDQFTIPDDSVATVSMAALLGNNFVSVRPGNSSANLTDGSAIATERSPDLNTIMAQLGSLGDELKTALSNINIAFSGEGGGLFQRIDQLIAQNTANFTRTMDNLEAITTKIRDGDGTLGRLVNDPAAYDELVGALAEVRKAAAGANTFVADAQSVIAQVKSGEGTLGALIYNEDTGKDIQAVAKNLRELSDKLNSGQGTIGKLLADDTLYRDAQGVLRKAERALDGLSDQGPITAVGVAANALF